MKAEHIPFALGAVLVIGVFLIIAAMLVHAVPPENKDLVNIALGVMLTCLSTVVNFYFGSSKSSQAKDEALQEIAKG